MRKKGTISPTPPIPPMLILLLSVGIGPNKANNVACVPFGPHSSFFGQFLINFPAIPPQFSLLASALYFCPSASLPTPLHPPIPEPFIFVAFLLGIGTFFLFSMPSLRGAHTRSLVQSFFCQPFSVHFANSLLTGRTLTLATEGDGRENQLGPKSSQKVPISECQCRDRGEKKDVKQLKGQSSIGDNKNHKMALYFYCIPKRHQYQRHQIIIIAIFASSQLKRRRALSGVADGSTSSSLLYLICNVASLELLI